MQYPCGWVSPFGHCRIKACCQLPDTFRRLPRPSSPLTAKASTVCAYSLDHITSSRLKVVCAWGYKSQTRISTTFQMLGTRSPRLSLTTHLSILHLKRFATFRFSQNTSKPQRLHASKMIFVYAVIQSSSPWLISLSPFSSWLGAEPRSGLRPVSGFATTPQEKVVGLGGLEPPASPLSGVRSNHLSYRPNVVFLASGGACRDRTDDPLLAKQVLSQLS